MDSVSGDSAPVVDLDELPVERRVVAALGQQLGMGPALDDPALVEDEHQVGAADRAQPVRDDEARAARAAASTSACCSRASVSASIELVASSRIDDPRVGEQRAA